MPLRRLRWYLFPTYLLLSLLPLAVFAWIGADLIRDSFYTEAVAGLTAQTRMAEDALSPFLAAGRPGLEQKVREQAALSGARITVVLPAGQVAADSDADTGQMGNHADREEIAAALAGGIGTSTRYSYTVRHDMLYLALPHRAAGAVTAVVRLAVPLISLQKTLARFYRRLLAAGVAIALITIILALLASRHISRPLEEIQAGARRFAQGDLAHKLRQAPFAEAAGLVECLNQMAGQLNERLQTVSRQQNELEAVLTSMAEGVLAFDLREKLLNLNPSAAQLFNLDPRQARGRTLTELIRNTQLQQLVTACLSSETPLESDLLLLGDKDRYLHAQGTALRDAAGRRIGVLLVLHDITRLRQLEALRREFVANVSHELKTPITLLQGFIETLQEGALAKPEDARRFLGIMAKQTERLNAIIEDLLALSRIEQDTERGQIALETGDLGSVVAGALAICQPAADAKRIRLETEGADEAFTAKINRRLLEQALVNLIDNAVKYSDPGTLVRVAVRREPENIIIEVRDQGPGIEAEHLPRLFERFYRVDRSRSRDAGGSGLGLAIVKHILQAHGGRAAVESRPGQGSTFSLFLPTL